MGGGWDMNRIGRGCARRQRRTAVDFVAGSPRSRHLLGLSKSAGYLWGAPGGGRASSYKRCAGLMTRSLEALGKVDIMLVMSSEAREGLVGAGHALFAWAVTTKATADNGALSAVPSEATLPRLQAAGRGPLTLHAGHITGGRGIKSDLFSGAVGRASKLDAAVPAGSARPRRSTRGACARGDGRSAFYFVFVQMDTRIWGDGFT
jgi:hypothetical protein